MIINQLGPHSTRKTPTFPHYQDIFPSCCSPLTHKHHLGLCQRYDELHPFLLAASESKRNNGLPSRDIDKYFLNLNVLQPRLSDILFKVLPIAVSTTSLDRLVRIYDDRLSASLNPETANSERRAHNTEDVPIEKCTQWPHPRKIASARRTPQ